MSDRNKKAGELMENMMRLQNGSDIRGVACEGIEGENVNLTPAHANVIGQSFANWLAKKTGKPVRELRIGVGIDSRITGPALMEGLLMGLEAAGAHTYNCGLVSTPSMFMTVVYPEFRFDGSVMITASHLPFNRNGLKFFDADGGLEHDDITELLKTASTLTEEKKEIHAEQVNSISVYAENLRKKITDGVNATDREHPLTGLKVVVDAGNGAGGFFANDVLATLGADITGSQFLTPDGMFPNHIPNPENKQAMEMIRTAVLENHADLGIIFDTDVDRMSAVLDDGSEINRDAIIAMISAILAKDYPGGTIITDSVTSDRLTEFLETELGLKQLRFKRGYKNVINKCKELNAAGILSPLAMETSGHGALSENYYLDDGCYLAVKLLIAAANAAKEGRKLNSYIEKLKKGFDEREFRMKLLGDDFTEYGKNVLKVFEERALAMGLDVAPNSYEGVRISFNTEEIRGWLLLRLSLHDPIMPLNLEGMREGDCEKMLKLVDQLLDGFDRLIH